MLYPIFLNLEGKAVLVVGAGPVATAKLWPLVASGARATVVAPTAAPAVLQMAERNLVRYEKRRFEERDVEGKVLVIAASDNTVVNEAVMKSCRARGVWVNVVDDPVRCDFFVPSTVHRGRLQVAISTEGASPAFARRLRLELERRLHESLGEYVELLHEARKRIKATVTDPSVRRAVNEALLDSEARTSLECGDTEGARAAIARALESFEQKRLEA